MSGGKNSKFGKLNVEGIIRFFRRAFPSGTANNVSAETGISPSTIDKWMRKESRPSSDHIGALLSAFGPAFFIAAYPQAEDWLQPEIDRQQAAKAAEILSALADQHDGPMKALIETEGKEAQHENLELQARLSRLERAFAASLAD